MFHQAYASDNQAWNSAVGLGTDAGGRYGARGGERERAIGGKSYASAIGNGLKWLAEHQGDNGSFAKVNNNGQHNGHSLLYVKIE